MTRILLRGCNGRMGRMIADLAAQSEDVTVAAGVDIVPGGAAFPVFTELSGCNIPADVLVDFTRADGIEDSITYAAEHRMALLVGTTGLSPAQRDKLREASRAIPVFLASNLSMGVALLERLSKSAASFLREDFDVEIVETHHNQKLDAPSGTALTLAEAVRDGLDTVAPFIYGRQGRMPRNRGEIGIHALRGGTVTGTHEVNFFGHDETITLTHRAQSRGVFAAGAIRAARFLAGKPAGWYTMGDIVAQAQNAREITEADGFVAVSDKPLPSPLQVGNGKSWTAFLQEGDGQAVVLLTLKDDSLDEVAAAKVLSSLIAREIPLLLAQSAKGEVRVAVEPAWRKVAREALEV